ncbi:MAG: helix-turn-helix transcriptional regulator, partial [Planctomycetes bacterium]|nr:helix-turn-helix transcriptional regulator [Planctomycetota bacterium]
MVKAKSPTQKEFIVLGLLNECPSHGYELERKIKDRGIRNWTTIGFSSIYHLLKKLEDSGFIDHESRIVNGKTQQVFQLTKAGHAELNSLIETGLTSARGQRGDFSVAIS